MQNVIIPKGYVEKTGNPIIFLAGPIRGAPNWQDEAIDLILSQERDITIVSPRRGVRDSIAKYVVSGDDVRFPRQRAWERHYLDRASQNGAILFWLPGEAEHRCEKVYGAMTRLELGQWMTRYNQDPSVRFCVGTDGKFPEMSTIEYDLYVDAPDKRINKTLKATCLEALRLAHK